MSNLTPDQLHAIMADRYADEGVWHAAHMLLYPGQLSQQTLDECERACRRHLSDPLRAADAR